MTKSTCDIAFTPSVKDFQERLGSRRQYARVEMDGGWPSEITPALVEFLATADSFYLATASTAGQPYVQHRGGPPGFLRALDDQTLAFADFSGNRQYITLGNLAENPRAFIFLMDYRNRRRLKLWGCAEAIENDDALLARLSDPEYKGKPERVIRFHLEAWDINCPAHIQRRLDEREVIAGMAEMQRRIEALESENGELRARLAALQPTASNSG